MKPIPSETCGKNISLSLMQELKAETSGLHKELDKEVQKLGLLRIPVKMKDYTHILIKFYGLYKPVEDQLLNLSNSSNLLSQLCWKEKRCHKDRLMQDIKAINPIINLDHVPLYKDIDLHAIDGHILGALYVLEGATLGGQVISRHLATNADFPQNYLSFFHGYGKDTGKMWKSFADVCNQFEVQFPDQRSQVIDGACTLFDAFIDWMNN